jgi:hypothetical protein
LARNNSGWIKWWRKVEVSFDGKPIHWEFAWLKLLSWANFGDSQTPILMGNKKIYLKRGQLVTSRAEICEAAGLKDSAGQRFLSFLVKANSIRTTTGQHGTIITICNYDKYQGENFEADSKRTANEQRPDNDRTDHKNIEEGKEEKSIYSASPNSEKRPHLLFEIWNQHCSPLPPESVLSVRRDAECRKRWAEKPDEKYWIKVVKLMATNPFFNGDNSKGMVWDFPMFIKEETHRDVTRGRYKNKKSKNQNMRPPEDFIRVVRGGRPTSVEGGPENEPFRK